MRGRQEGPKGTPPDGSPLIGRSAGNAPRVPGRASPPRVMEIRSRYRHWWRFWIPAVLRRVPAATLQGANLQGADLRGADLALADLRGANLEGARLADATLFDAQLEGANMRGADLRRANLFR